MLPNRNTNPKNTPLCDVYATLTPPTMNLAQNLILAQRADLATHILINTPNNTKAICGAEVGTFLSWNEKVSYRNGRYMNPHGFCEKDPKRYIDCQRCCAIFEKNRPDKSK